MTYSILALDREAGLIGVAVQSHYFGVGSLVPWARAGVGVVATQSVVRAAYGTELLDALEAGETPEAAIAAAIARDAGRAARQIAVLGIDGRGAAHTGDGCIAAAGHLVADGLTVQANLVTGDAVWRGMAEAFAGTAGPLERRMLAALDAAEAAGGDLRGRQAAAITIVRTTGSGDLGADIVLDLRVDDHPEPLVELRRLARSAGALAGLVRMLEEPGLLTGPPIASRESIERTLDELALAQAVLGETNGEPSAWAGLLLARVGRDDEATAAFARATAAGLATAALLRSLAAAGMWIGDPDRLVRLAEPHQR